MAIATTRSKGRARVAARDYYEHHEVRTECKHEPRHRDKAMLALAALLLVTWLVGSVGEGVR
jgi:hypothetical protein